MNYYYCSNGTDVVGPCSVEELQTLVMSGALPLSAQVCAEGQETWQPISTVASKSDPPRRSNPIPDRSGPPSNTTTTAPNTAAARPAIQSNERAASFTPPQQTAPKPVALFFGVLLAIVVGGGLFLLARPKPQVITGYETKILFVGEDDYSASSEFRELTHSGWEIKNSRRAWAKHPYKYDQKQWGEEYTLQKALYGTPK